ncbi:hypothetical protein QBC39DRAFT_162856 [Podospora conica]|nr:hypothetical protein QBC39DRAFT_162856 [Schizothecium conicum]
MARFVAFPQPSSVSSVRLRRPRRHLRAPALALRHRSIVACSVHSQRDTLPSSPSRRRHRSHRSVAAVASLPSSRATTRPIAPASTRRHVARCEHNQKNAPETFACLLARGLFFPFLDSTTRRASKPSISDDGGLRSSASPAPPRSDSDSPDDDVPARVQASPTQRLAPRSEGNKTTARTRFLNLWPRRPAIPSRHDSHDSRPARAPKPSRRRALDTRFHPAGASTSEVQDSGGVLPQQGRARCRQSAPFARDGAPTHTSKRAMSRSPTRLHTAMARFVVFGTRSASPDEPFSPSSRAPPPSSPSLCHRRRRSVACSGHNQALAQTSPFCPVSPPSLRRHHAIARLRRSVAAIAPPRAQVRRRPVACSEHNQKARRRHSLVCWRAGFFLFFLDSTMRRASKPSPTEHLHRQRRRHQFRQRRQQFPRRRRPFRHDACSEGIKMTRLRCFGFAGFHQTRLSSPPRPAFDSADDDDAPSAFKYFRHSAFPTAMTPSDSVPRFLL